jgi:O-antigen/teichoic acid export membrane protein
MYFGDLTLNEYSLSKYMRALVFYSGLYGGSAALLKLIGFGVFLWLARTLSVDEFASFSLLFAAQQALATFAWAGIVEAVIGLLKVNQAPDQRAWLFTNANFAFLFMALSAIIFALIASVFLLRDGGITLVSYIGVFGSGVLLAWAAFQSQLVRLKELHIGSLLFSFFPPLGGMLGGFIAVFLERTAQSFFIGGGIGVLIPVLGLWVSRVCFGACIARLGEVRRILWRALPFTAVAFLGWLSGYGNSYIINVFFAPAEVAKFTFALSLSSILILIAGALNQVWSPRFFRLIHELPFEQVEKKNRHFFRALGFVLGSVSGGIIILFPSAMALLGGNLLSYQHMGLELSFLFAAYVLLTPWWHCQNHFLAHAMGPSVLKITLITSTIGIGILVALMWRLGPIGVYVGLFVQMLLRSLGMFLVARRNWSIDVSWEGIVAGLFLIVAGFILSSSGVQLVYSVPGYMIIVAMFVWLFFKSVLNRRIAR